MWVTDDFSPYTYLYGTKIYHNTSSARDFVPVLKEYAEKVVFGQLAASITANLDDGNIHWFYSNGYTGAVTLAITGQSTSTSTKLVQNMVIVIDNAVNEDNISMPTISWAGADFSEETGAPDISSLSDAQPGIIIIPFVHFTADGSSTGWYGGSQLTYLF
jgi:hypothetical protein